MFNTEIICLSQTIIITFYIIIKVYYRQYNTNTIIYYVIITIIKTLIKNKCDSLRRKHDIMINYSPSISSLRLSALYARSLSSESTNNAMNSLISSLSTIASMSSWFEVASATSRR